MASNNFYTLAIIFAAGFVTILLRLLPFIAFSKHQPKFILYLGRVLPPATMTLLIVFCVKDTNLNYYALPEIIACLIVIILHVWKHNTLLSIIAGTAVYMYLIQNAGGIF